MADTTQNDSDSDEQNDSPRTLSHEDRLQALKLIEAKQRGPGNNLMGATAEVVVKIGGTSDSGMVEHETLYIEKAPDAILRKLREEGFAIHIEEGRAQITKPEGDA